MMTSDTIPLDYAARWLAHMAAADGVVSPGERALLKDFAGKFGLDGNYLIRLAYGFAKDAAQEVELSSPQAVRGRKFEDLIVSLLADKSRYKLLQWRGDKISNGIYAKDTLLPDLLVSHRLKQGVVEYFIECKYRSNWNADGKVDLSGVFLRYRRNAKHANKELFIVLGVGGLPDKPEKFYIIPSRMINYYKDIPKERFVPCLCTPEAEAYHAYIQHYYDKRVFKVANT